MADVDTQDAATAPSTDVNTEEVVTTTASTASTASSAEETAEPEVFFGRYTADEINTLFGKAAQYDQLKQHVDGHIRKMDSQYGELKSRLTKKDEPIKLTAQQFKKVSELYGEDYAAAMAEDLGSVIRAPAFNEDELLPKVQEWAKSVLSEQEKDMEERVYGRIDRAQQEALLDDKQPGWREIAQGPEMALWEGLQSDETLQAIDESFKTKPFAKAMGKVLDDFDKWKEARAKRSASKQNLEAAVNPTSTGGKGQSTQKSIADFAEEQFQATRRGL